MVVYLLRKYWSLEQIARTLKRMSPNDARRQVSHEAIYSALYVMPAAASRKTHRLLGEACRDHPEDRYGDLPRCPA